MAHSAGFLPYCSAALLTLTAAPAGADQLLQGESPSPALFRQMATVFQHPRCMNCHTLTQYPRQGDDRHRHTMNVSRGPDDRGAAGLHCRTCHQGANQTSSGVPGVRDWRLAPLRMGWDGLTVGELCRAISDPQHGGMAPTQLAAHFSTDLVRWAWSPGLDSTGRPRSAPPLTHDRFLEITQQWIASGAACPAP